MCIPGHGGSKCALCDAGTFSRGGSPSSTKPQCTACPRGSTPGNGSTTAAACTVAGEEGCFPPPLPAVLKLPLMQGV
jgi:hypothetical protein